MADGVNFTDEIVSRSVSGTLEAWIDVSPFGSFVVPDGGGGGGGVPPPTGPTVFECAAVLPALFFAFTVARRSCPESAEATTYVVFVALAIEAQLLPPESQRSHWYVYEIGPWPIHSPAFAVSVCPTVGVPVIAGAVVFPGAVTPMGFVAFELAWPEPPEFVAVTSARIRWFTSALTSW
jgi:hypothetical protein